MASEAEEAALLEEILDSKLRRLSVSARFQNLSK